MITDTSIAHPVNNLNYIYGAHKPLAITAQELHQQYRVLATSLIDVTNPSVFYRLLQNDPNGYNGHGVHEKFIYNGMSVVDVSFGNLDYPWFAADANANNEITLDQLQSLANFEKNPIVSPRLRAIANFALQLPPYTRFYHYVGRDGIRAITIDDQFNCIKLNCIITQQFQY